MTENRLKSLAPAPIRRFLRSIHRAGTLYRALRAVEGIQAGTAVPADLAGRLYSGWGNEAYSAKPPLLLTIIEQWFRSAGAVLECGSGLSTLVLGALATGTDRRVITLESDAAWAAKVRRWLRYRGSSAVTVIDSPLQDFGSYEWYVLPPAGLPPAFGLVIVDGPPGTSKGGRVGLMPRLGDRLQAGTVIVLDDCNRSGEQRVMTEWSQALGTSPRLVGDGSVAVFSCVGPVPGGLPPPPPPPGG